MIWEHLLVSCRSGCLLSGLSHKQAFHLDLCHRSRPALLSHHHPWSVLWTVRLVPLRAHGHSGTLGLSASHEWILVVLQLLYRRAATAGKIIIMLSSSTCSWLMACSPAVFPATPFIFYTCLSFSLLLDFESTYNVSLGCFHYKRLTMSLSTCTV